MAPASPKLAKASAFPTWDDLVAESTPEEQLAPYQLPFDEGDVVTIPCPDGARYLDILHGQSTGDGRLIIESLIPDVADRTRVIDRMRGVHFGIVDTLTSKVLRYYYGLSIETEAQAGNSPAS